jgi:hypothetical protein
MDKNKIIFFIIILIILLIINYFVSINFGFNIFKNSLLIILTLLFIFLTIKLSQYIIKYYNNNYQNLNMINDNKNQIDIVTSNNLNQIKANEESCCDYEESIEDTTIKHEEILKPEVFNIHNNIFTYKEAKDLCASYNSKLATHEQVVDAYKKGANWCNYGWSADQNALFPVQKSNWDNVQSNPKTQFSCGNNYGINGGYFDENNRFGVNCYGIKPKNDKCKNKSVEEEKINWSKMHDKLDITSWSSKDWSEYGCSQG